MFVVSGFCVTFVRSNSSSFIKQSTTMKAKFFNYRKGDNIIRFKVGVSGNQKITLTNSAIVETFTFSKSQFEYVMEKGSGFFGLIEHDNTNCMNCPFSKNQNYSGGAKCYTHKYRQLEGFYSILRNSIARNHSTFEDIAEMDGENVPAELLKAVQGKYVRFGTYGEPVVIPFKWVAEICQVAKNWTSYTHQWANPDYQDFKDYFMASVHSPEQAEMASAMGWRYFETFRKGQTPSAGSILCPADRKKVSCETCGLCSGLKGKGNAKSVNIKLH